MNPSKLTRSDYWAAGLALALAIDLLALPWVDVSIGPFSYSSSGTGSPDGFLGVLALLVSLAVGADVVMARVVPSVVLPALEAFGRGRARVLAAALAAALVVLKLLLHLHPSYLGAGCWIGLVLAAGLVFSSTRLAAQPAPIAAPAAQPSAPGPGDPVQGS